jgi:DNA-binding GntR family transcriptional regulator
MVRGWFGAAGLSELGGVLSLRKTWQYHSRSDLSPEVDSSDGDMADSVLRPVRVKTTQEQVYIELERAIVSGRIPPGERIFIEDVAKQMGVSPIPVREAFGRLEAGGFITKVPKRGSVVDELSVEHLKELLQLRLVIESIAARKAALTRTEETIGRLARIHEQWIVACNGDDVDELLRVNREFHYTLYRDANMPILQALIDYLWNRMSPYLHILLPQRDIYDPQMDIQLHEGMLDGMKQGDPRKVVKWLKADLNDAARLIVELFSIYRKA